MDEVLAFLKELIKESSSRLPLSRVTGRLRQNFGELTVLFGVSTKAPRLSDRIVEVGSTAVLFPQFSSRVLPPSALNWRYSRYSSLRIVSVATACGAAESEHLSGCTSSVNR